MRGKAPEEQYDEPWKVYLLYGIIILTASGVLAANWSDSSVAMRLIAGFMVATATVQTVRYSLR